MEIRFVKYSALGNDYLVIDPSSQSTPFGSLLESNLAASICERRGGIGADGMLYGPLPYNCASAGSPTKSLVATRTLNREEGKAPFLVRIFNSDGSEAEKSGNGLRIFARYLLDEGYTKADRFELATSAGLASVEVSKGGMLRMGLGRVSFRASAEEQIAKEQATARGNRKSETEERGAVESEAVQSEAGELIHYPLTIRGRLFYISSLSLGNPHCAILIEGDDDLQALARQFGPDIERHPLFPYKTNVQFMRVRDRNRLELAIWERGSGYTLSSGSSSAAAAAVAHRLGLLEPKAMVDMAGGTLEVELLPTGEVYICGDARRVGCGLFIWQSAG